jgi:tetratricopeptide (TPR) repeat protein
MSSWIIPSRPRFTARRSSKYLCFPLVLLSFGFLSLLFAGDDWPTQIETLIQNKELATAEKMIIAKLVATPRDPELITLLAEVRFDQERFQEVSKLLDDAAEIAGPSAKGETLRGLVAVAQNRLDLAEPKFRAAIKLDPKYAFAHYYLGRLLYKQNHFNEAIQESQAAIETDPDLVRAYENLGLCYEGQQRIDEAEKWYLEAIRREKTGGRQTEWPSLDLATMMIRNNRIDEAKAHLLEALRLNPHNPESHFQMAILLEKSGDLQGALQELQKTLSLNPKKAEAHYRSARILQRLGKKEEAQQEFDLFKKTSESQHQPN